MVTAAALEAQASTVLGTTKRTVNSIDASPEAQASTVAGLSTGKRTASGTLLAQPSTVDGVGITTEPYVGMPFPAVYVGMPFPAKYVAGVIQPE